MAEIELLMRDGTRMCRTIEEYVIGRDGTVRSFMIRKTSIDVVEFLAENAQVQAVQVFSADRDFQSNMIVNPAQPPTAA